MMSIEMANGVYCPLSPEDPPHRLHTLIQQTQSHLVLVHSITKDKFDGNHVVLDIDDVIKNTDSMVTDADVALLSNMEVTWENIAYVIFTSGSTGTPKGVSIIQFRFRLILYYVIVLMYRFKFGIVVLSDVLNHSSELIYSDQEI